MDRAFISDSHRKLVEELAEKDILGFNLAENKESFLLAAALGLNSPEDMKGKKFNYVRFDTFKADDKALIAASLLGTYTSDKEIDNLADFDQSVSYCERCAEHGYEELQKSVKNADWDNELLEARLLKKLDQLYAQNVEDDL